MKKIVLASTSIYRREQLNTLGIAFESHKPSFDEESAKHQILAELKNPRDIAGYLSFKKGESIAKANCITISGDQLVAFDGQMLGKPGSREKSIEQLLKLQNKTHELVTACTVFDGTKPISILNTTMITLKPLSIEQIKTYVDLDEPWECAGSYKIEKHGIQIMDSILTDDFTAIQGLPLLSLSKILGSLNISIPGGHDDKK